MSKHFHCFNQWSIKNLHVLICHIQSTPNLSFWIFLAFSLYFFFFFSDDAWISRWMEDRRESNTGERKFLKRKMLFQWNPTSQVLIVISCDFTFWPSIGNFNLDVHFSGWMFSFSTLLMWKPPISSCFDGVGRDCCSLLLSYPPNPFDVSAADTKSTYLGFPGNSG